MGSSKSASKPGSNNLSGDKYVIDRSGERN